MTGRLKTPAEAAEILGISRGTITRCKQQGAPVQYIGPCGRKYLIDTDLWFDWMQQRGESANQIRPQTNTVSIAELRARRHASVGKRIV